MVIWLVHLSEGKEPYNGGVDETSHQELYALSPPILHQPSIDACHSGMGASDAIDALENVGLCGA
ncbi:hypothetical protein [Bradyrhizobium sp. CCGUVB14]|uniref:hypothetical protein n=1 Tax=Bradyrhizobium sp. CCGUVB14 TaxID=2949628 RepID=UPI0020B424AF|nr:hypothetical protein [Bradyrhizobium sp. CCGUVB14]MCP3447194.1 hypothetical protein [Bradyrhizobium sp. CCGUVB14]